MVKGQPFRIAESIESLQNFDSNSQEGGRMIEIAMMCVCPIRWGRFLD